MTYVIDIRIDDRKRSYRVEAKNEEEAKERLALRLPPAQREGIVIDAIKIDMTTVGDDSPYGEFGGE